MEPCQCRAASMASGGNPLMLASRLDSWNVPMQHARSWLRAPKAASQVEDPLGPWTLGIHSSTRLRFTRFDDADSTIYRSREGAARRSVSPVQRIAAAAPANHAWTRSVCVPEWNASRKPWKRVLKTCQSLTASRNPPIPREGRAYGCRWDGVCT